jgi:hypothetical protein
MAFEYLILGKRRVVGKYVNLKHSKSDTLYWYNTTGWFPLKKLKNKNKLSYNVASRWLYLKEYINDGRYRERQRQYKMTC